MDERIDAVDSSIDRYVNSPVHFCNNADQVINVRISQPLSCLIFRHEGIIYIDVTIKVKTVLMLLVWIASIAVQPETATNNCYNTAFIPFHCSVYCFFLFKLLKHESK